MSIKTISPDIFLPDSPITPDPSIIAEKTMCALCHLPAKRPIMAVFNGEEHPFCCYGCRHIYELVAPEIANGLGLPQAMGQAGLDLSAPCCRGVIHGDPATEAQNVLSRLMFNAFLGMMVMVSSLALYSEATYDWGASGQGARTLLQLMALLFATPSVLLLALPILEDAILTFQVYRRLTTSALIAIGSLAAYGLSVYATFSGHGHTYFETAVMTLLLVTLGRWLDAKTLVEGDKAVAELLSRAPTEASLLMPDGSEQLTSVSSLQVGDNIHVRPGENFSVDGRVTIGEGSVNEASITGEAAPAYKSVGDTVYAGTLSVDGSFQVEVTQVGEDRVIGKLVRLLDEARLYRAPIERLADTVAAYFVPTVIILAILTFSYWSWQAGWERGMLNGLAVLLIACPCALGIATPLTIWTGLGRAAQRGILIRDSRTLEKLSHIKHLFFDKTGTLTTGLVTLSEIVLNPTENLGAEDLLQVAASLEYHSEHPLAHSILLAAEEKGLALMPASSFQAIPGLGIIGQVDGRDVFVGSWRLVAQKNIAMSPQLLEAKTSLEQAGLTVVHVGWDGITHGLLGLKEIIRSEAAAALAEMKEHDLTVAVLTGDSEAVGQALGKKLSVPVFTQLLPTNKVEHVAQVETIQPVAMVGDGLNDAPALARATVGIALGTGADVTRESADVSLLGEDLSLITWTFSLARRVYQTIRWNLVWAFVYNVIGIGLAMFGLLHPILAAAAMVISSALVVGNSLRLRSFQ